MYEVIIGIGFQVERRFCRLVSPPFGQSTVCYWVEGGSGSTLFSHGFSGSLKTMAFAGAGTYLILLAVISYVSPLQTSTT